MTIKRKQRSAKSRALLRYKQRAPISIGKTRQQISDADARNETKVKRRVRVRCVDRDGSCRYAKDDAAHVCDGRSEWAHFGAHKRAHTMGMSPERRHTTAGSFMLCRSAHRRYDAGALLIRALTDAGADGRLAYDPV